MQFLLYNFLHLFVKLSQQYYSDKNQFPSFYDDEKEYYEFHCEIFFKMSLLDQENWHNN